MHCTICVAKTKALISFAITGNGLAAPLYSHMHMVGFLKRRLNCLRHHIVSRLATRIRLPTTNVNVFFFFSNNFSVMSGRNQRFLCLTSSQRMKKKGSMTKIDRQENGCIKNIVVLMSKLHKFYDFCELVYKTCHFINKVCE